VVNTGFDFSFVSSHKCNLEEYPVTIRVKIAGIEKDISEVDPNWVNQQINGRRADGEVVCVQVTIHKDSVNLILITADCPHAISGSKYILTDIEHEILNLWRKLHLSESNFSGGNLIAFLHQVK
jgi:hypothetical protein